jgi:hypothetical protein
MAASLLSTRSRPNVPPVPSPRALAGPPIFGYHHFAPADGTRSTVQPLRHLRSRGASTAKWRGIGRNDMERIAECHCGQLRAITSGEPDSVYVRHCKACQRRTGAIIHNGSRWLKNQVRIEGEHKIYARKGDSGFEIRFHFCPNCGTSVLWEGDRSPTTCGIAVGCFSPTRVSRRRLHQAGRSRCTRGWDCPRILRTSRKRALEGAGRNWRGLRAGGEETVPDRRERVSIWTSTPRSMSPAI